MVLNKEELVNAKWEDKINIKCNNCGEIIKRSKRYILRNNKTDNHYCNNKCQGEHSRNIARKLILDAGKKKCGLCKDEKELEEFNKNKGTPDGYNKVCRICSKERSKKYYAENTEKHRKNVYDRNKKINNANRKKMFEYKSTHPCVDCGEDDPIVLQFDHLRDKKYQVSKMSGYSWEKMMEEIEKCEVRCANCHTKKTAKDFDWYVNELMA